MVKRMIQKSSKQDINAKMLKSPKEVNMSTKLNIQKKRTVD